MEVGDQVRFRPRSASALAGGPGIVTAINNGVVTVRVLTPTRSRLGSWQRDDLVEFQEADLAVIEGAPEVPL